MSRLELLPFENQLVEFVGYVDRWVERQGKHRDVLLKGVKLRRYRTDETTFQREQQPFITTDHLWQRSTAEQLLNKPRRLDYAYGFGRIAWYRRADHSVDLGLEPVFVMTGHELAADITELIKQGQWAEAHAYLSKRIALMRKQQLIVSASNRSNDQILADLEGNWLPLVQSNLTKQQQAPRRGKPKGARTFADLLSAKA